MRAKDLIGKTFTYLTVVERCGSRNNHALWHCKCKCGKDVYAVTEELTTGKTKSCGCYKQEMAHGRLEDFAGRKVGRLTVLEYAGRNNDRRALWKCKCDCGNECIKNSKYLQKTDCASCGCWEKELTGERSRLDITGERRFMLTAIKPTRIEDHQQYWLFKCDCGNEIERKISLFHADHIKSCGCIKDSYGESMITKYLKQYNVNFTTEKRFKGLVSESGMPLRYDFAVYDDDGRLQFLIEHHGPQHYQKYANGFGDYQREVSDKIKEEYCKDNNIPLYIIRYDADYELEVKNILTQTHIIYDNSVPSCSNTEG